MRWPLLMCLALMGCDEPPIPNHVERVARSEKARSTAPDIRSYHVQGGELVVIDVPTGMTGNYLDTQRCFLWRDSEYRTASMQCPTEASGEPADIH